jgi:CRISPR-associated protein Cas1
MEMISRHAWTGSDYDWRKDIKSMEQNRLTIPERKDSQELMGIEGVCSQIYFGAFGRMLTCDFRNDAHVFRGRNR